MLLLTLMAALHLQAVPDAELQIEQGRVLIRELREEEALAVLSRFYGDATLPAPLRARALIYGAVAELHLDREPHARQLFRRALEEDPGAAVPSWVSRRVRATFDEVQLEYRVSTAAPEGATAPPPEVSKASSTAPMVLAVASGLFAAVSVGSFIAWRSDYRAAVNERVANESDVLARRSRIWWYAGMGTGATALGLGAGALLFNRSSSPPDRLMLVVTGRW